ncbi:MAG: c-type cytochrome [Chitinophagaceae bacterium]|nr:c-type cytochrome [Chitinophagaceae bacterium]
MVRRIFKWTGIIILSLVFLITVTVSLRQNLTYDAPYPEITASHDSSIIARGREIVIGPAHCGSCHSLYDTDSLVSLGQDPIMTGGVTFKLPFATLYSRNITPDPETGIGKRTDKEIARLLRYGVNPDGTAVLDFMPFHDVSDEDMTAIISYLRSLKPVRNKIPDHEWNIMGNVLKAFLVKPVGPSAEVPKTVKRDTSAEYGKYLALSVANCNGCHTERDMTGGFIGEPFAGGSPMTETGKEPLIPPNLTMDSSSRIFGWKQEDFIARVRVGRVIKHSHMPWNSYKLMADNDLKAIYNYLKTLKPVKTGTLLPGKKR